MIEIILTLFICFLSLVTNCNYREGLDINFKDQEKNTHQKQILKKRNTRLVSLERGETDIHTIPAEENRRRK